MSWPSHADFKFDFGGWTTADYAAALRAYKHHPPQLPRDSAQDIEAETVRLRIGLAKLGLAADAPRLWNDGVRSRHKLATVQQVDITRLGLVGTLAQYELLYVPALEEYVQSSSECELCGEFTAEELFELLSAVKESRDSLEAFGRNTKRKLYMDEQPVAESVLVRE